MIVLTGKSGQLGNRLFMSAYALSLAELAGTGLINTALDEFADFFTGPTRTPLMRLAGALGVRVPLRRTLGRLGEWTRIALGRLPGSALCRVHVPLFEKSGPYHLNEPTFIGRVRGTWWNFVAGWVQIEAQAFPNPDAVRAFFSLRADLAETVRAAVAAARGDAEVLVGVHIRRGDYAGYLGGIYFYPHEAYWAAMRRVLELHAGRRVRFLVCSNEAFEPPSDLAPLVARGPGAAVTDLYALAGCDLLFGPPSSFTLWAAFYGGGRLWEMRAADALPGPGSFTARPLKLEKQTVS